MWINRVFFSYRFRVCYHWISQQEAQPGCRSCETIIMSLGGLSVTHLNLNDTVAEYEITYKNPFLGISVGLLCVLSILRNGFILAVFAFKESWDNKTKFDVSMVCSSLVIAVFFLPLCSYKLLGAASPHTSHVVCVVVDAIQGYCVLNHLLTACVTSVWNFINVKFSFASDRFFPTCSHESSNCIIVDICFDLWSTLHICHRDNFWNGAWLR